MARKYEITRTVDATKVTILVFNKTTAEPENVSIIVSGKYTDINDRKLEKLILKNWNNDEQKFIEIVDLSDVSKVYGISLETFLANAVELDPKTRQPKD